MNRMFAIFSIVALISCDSDDTNNSQTLSGKWNLIGMRTGMDGPDDWSEEVKKETYTFSADGSLTTSKYPGCSGTYIILDNTINFVVDCNGQQYEWNAMYNLDKYLVMSFSDVMCYEGCFYRYKRA